MVSGQKFAISLVCKKTPSIQKIAISHSPGKRFPLGTLKLIINNLRIQALV